MSKCYRNPFDIPLDVSPALIKAQRLLDATRIERLLAVCIHQNILPCLSSRQSLIDSSLHIGTPGIAYAFLRLAAASPEVLTNAELDPLVCSSTALQLLAGVQDGANNGEHDPGSLLFGEAGKCLVETLAAEAGSEAQSHGILRYLGFQEPRALSDARDDSDSAQPGCDCWISGRAGFLHGLLLLRGVVAAAEDNAAATDAAHAETDAETAAGAEAAHLARVSVARQLDDAIDAVASRLLASSLAYGRRVGARSPLMCRYEDQEYCVTKRRRARAPTACVLHKFQH
jgi:hypothetical protein